MSTHVSPLAVVDPKAQLGTNVTIGPFCTVGPDVVIGDGTTLESHVVVTGNTTIGQDNRIFPHVVIGAEPQDVTYHGSHTRVEIGNGNLFREGVTVNRGADKEDGCTRIGNHNMFMANSHIAHNSHIFDHVILVNGVLLGGHVHVQDRAIVSGNSVVHHFSTVGTLAFVSGGCRVPHDIPPYMLAAGSDNPQVRTINIVGMKRAGISERTITLVKQAHRLIFREHRPLGAVREHFDAQLDGVLPLELMTLLGALERSEQGKMGRAREAFRDQPVSAQQANTQRKAG